MDYLTDLTFPSQNSDRFFQKYLSIGLNIVPGCPLVGSCYPVEGIMAFHDDSATQQQTQHCNSYHDLIDYFHLMLLSDRAPGLCSCPDLL